MNNYKRSIVKIVIDNIFFPLRALFVPEESNFFLTSLRDERFERVAYFCEGKVLDIGCGRGNLFIKNFIGLENGVGIDVFEYEGVENIVKDLTNLPFAENMFDSVTLIAVGGHIPKKSREQEFKEIARVLKPNGKLIMTEGEPVTQYLTHKWRHLSYSLLGQKDMDTERGMEEDEEYCIPSPEIMIYLNEYPLTFIRKVKFMWGLNNIYISRKIINK